MKVKFTKTSIQNGVANLVALYNNLLAGNPIVTQNATLDDIHFILDDTGSRINFDIDQEALELLVTDGGDIEEGIFAIKVDDTFEDLPIDAGMPFELNAFGESRTYANWFVPGAEIYKEDAGDGYIFYTNPGHGIANASQYLKACQIKTIIDLDPAFSCMSTQKFKADYFNQGWTKIVW